MKISRRKAISVAVAGLVAAVTGKLALLPEMAQALTASYPTSVVSWTDKVGGNTILADDINQLYAEVIAIEDALLNGFSHNLRIED